MGRIGQIGQYTRQLLLTNKHQSTAGSRVGPSASTASFVSFVAFVHSKHGAERRIGRVHARVTLAVSPTTAYRPRMRGSCARARLGSSTVFTSDGGSAKRATLSLWVAAFPYTERRVCEDDQPNVGNPWLERRHEDFVGRVALWRRRTVRHRGVRRLLDDRNPSLRILGVGWTEARKYSDRRGQ